MTIHAILIGFSYKGTSRELPGTVVDLCRMSNYCRSVGIPYEVVTDITRDEPIGTLLTSMIKGIVTPNVETFVKDNHTRCRKNLSEVTLPLSTKKLLLYFTGHGEDGHLVRPDGVAFSIEEVWAELPEVRSV